MSQVVGWIIGIAIVLWLISSFGNLGKYDGETAEYWFNAYDEAEARVLELQNKVSDHEEALNEANSNIEEANNNIEDAKYSAWSSYDDMGYALDNLDTVDTVSEP